MTVKELNGILNKMHSVYPFDEEKTIVYTGNVVSHEMDRIRIQTVDENTGVIIHMEKAINAKEDE